MSIPKLNLLSGFGGGNFSLGTGSKLLQKRSWLVIVGDEAPVGEVNNANAIATFLRRKFNLVPLRGSWKAEYADKRALLSKYPNILVVGGFIANEWAYIINEVVEPKYEIIKVKERESGQSWRDYMVAGGLTGTNFIVNGVLVPASAHLGMIGKGTMKTTGLRASQVVSIGGWVYEDTCVMVKAFMENAEAGLYDALWTATVPNMDVNPEGMAYNKRP